MVVLSSEAYYFGKINLDDLGKADRGNYQRWAAYSASKLANQLFTVELSRRCAFVVLADQIRHA